MIIPSGTVTFLFTDIEGSTKLSQQFPDEAAESIKIHNKILTDAVNNNNGYIFKTVGDSVCAAFSIVSDAVKAAVESQINLKKQNWNVVIVKVRMGINTGAAEWQGSDYSGYITLSRTQRIMAAGHGGQILLSDSSYTIIKNELIEGISFRDLGLKRLKDILYPVNVYQVLNDRIPDDFPPVISADVSPNNLPIQLNSFIGREKDLEELFNEINNNRLITLLGTGGAGKTRLSIQTGLDLIDKFNNGVWLIELAPISEPESLPFLVSEIFGIKEEKNKPLRNTLVEYFKDKEMLLIFDNCEHLIVSCAKLISDILQKTKKIKILVTSREALNTEGEKIHRIHSLSVPEFSKKPDIDELNQFESVRLFIDRIKSFQPEFSITDANAPAVAQICCHLGGIPLALELAAARVRTMSVEMIVERLDNSFKILTGGKRTSLPRQQTLRALIDWSYELLLENEKLLFRRLSVFRGGWDLECAEAICTGEDLDEFDILDLMTQLQQKSLIESETEKEKFKMLETIRMYSLEKLKESGELQLMEEKHLKYYVNYSFECKSILEEKNDSLILQKVDKQIDNIKFAIENSLKNKNYPDALNISMSLFDYWYMKGFYSEGKDFILRSVIEPDAIEESILGKAFTQIAYLFYSIGDYKKAINYSLKSIEILTKFSDKNATGKAYNTLGITYMDNGDYEKSMECLMISGKLSEETSNNEGLVSNYINKGNYWYYMKEYDKTLENYDKAQKISEKINDVEGLATIYHNTALIHQNMNNLEDSIIMHEKSLELREKTGNTNHIALSLQSIGNLYTDLLKYDKAEEYYKKSLKIYESIGAYNGITDVTFSMGLLFYLEGKPDKAEEFHKKSIRSALKIMYYAGIAFNLEALARLKENEKDFASAAMLLGKSFEIWEDKELTHDKDDESSIDLVLLEKRIKENTDGKFYEDNFSKGKSIDLYELIDIVTKPE